MNSHLNLRSPWPEVRERLKENDLTLSDEDLEYEPGNEQAMLERLSRKTKKSPEELREYIESISSNEDKAG